MDKFDLVTLLKYIRTVVSEVRKSDEKQYTFFWHNVDDLAWEHYISPKYVDARRDSQREYKTNTWVEVHSKNYQLCLHLRKKMQIVLACQFLGLDAPDPQYLNTIGKKSWLEAVKDLI